MKKTSAKFLSSSWPFFLLLFAVAVFFYPVVLENKVPIPGDFVVGVYYPWLDYKWGFPTGVPVKNPMTTDVVSFIFPMQMLAIDLLKNGQWPLWNPYILAGSPLLANFQSAPFSPTNVVYWMFDRLTAWSIQIMLQHLAAALFTFGLLRYFKVQKFAAVFGGIVFAFSGFNTIWSQWNGHTLTAAFIPLLILLQELWFKNKKWWAGPAFSVAIALQFLSGYPQAVLYTVVALGIFWIFSVEKNKDFLIRTAVLGVFGALGYGLAAFQLLPGAELLSLSQREVERHPFEWAFLPFSKVITFFAADYFGNHSTQNYWGPQDYTSNTGFVGVTAFILATVGILTGYKKAKVVRCLAVITISSLLLAFPTPLSIFFWKSGLFGLQAASAHRALVLFNLGIALLAAFGAGSILKKEKIPPVKSMALPTLVVGSFAVYVAILFMLEHQYPGKFTLPGITKAMVGIRNSFYPALILLLAAGTLWLAKNFSQKRSRLFLTITLLCLTSFELFRFGQRFTPFSPRHIVFPKTPILEFLEKQEVPYRTTGSRVIPINMRMPYKIETLEGYDAVYPLNIAKFIAAITGRRSGTTPTGRYATIGDETSNVLDLVNIKYNLAVKRNPQNQPKPEGETPLEFQQEKFKIAFEDKSTVVLENKNVLPRAFMVYDWVKVEGSGALDTFLATDFPISKKIVLEEDPQIPPKQVEEKPIVEYLKYSGQESIMKVTTKHDGLLFISDTYFPGWIAFIDSVETPIFKANFAFRAIPVKTGTHTVRMVYHPNSFFQGARIGIISALLLLLTSLFVFKYLKFTPKNSNATP